MEHTFFHAVFIWVLLVCGVFASASDSLDALIEVVLWSVALLGFDTFYDKLSAWLFINIQAQNLKLQFLSLNMVSP
jgi:hypothetical protein